MVNVQNISKGAINSLNHFSIPPWLIKLMSNGPLIIGVFIFMMMLLVGLKLYSVYKRKRG